MSSITSYLFLIRHGENDWVGTDRLAGRTSAVHLNEKGQVQATGLADLLANQPIVAIYSSPLERCLQTAQPLADKLAVPVVSEPGLLEVDYGEWRGGNLKELAKLPEWKMVQHFPSTFRFPGGETLRETQHRAVSTVEKLRGDHPNQVLALFSHADVIRLTLAHYLGTPLDLFQRVIVSTGAVSLIGFFDDMPAVLAMNYTAALPKVEIKPKDADQAESLDAKPK